MRASRLSTILAFALVTIACTSNRSDPPATTATAATPTTPATPSTPATPATPATPSTPATPATPATPSTPATPATPAAPPVLPTNTCDMTGTWRIKLILGEGGCGDLPNISLDLAVATGPANTIAGAARMVGTAPGSAVTLPALRVAPYTAPGTRCGLRVQWAQPSGERVELLFARERGGLSGGGSLWSTREGTPCRNSISVFGEYIAAQPESWSGLTAAAPWPRSPVAKPASAELAAASRKLTAKSVFGGPAVRRPRVALRGSIVDYVAAVVEDARAIKLFAVPCTAVAGTQCVAIVGDPCRPGQHEGEDCEGMYLTVVVDTTTGKLDRADSGGYPVATHADIEERLEEAP